MPVRAYPLCIIAGIGAGVWLADRRWRARGGQAGLISEIALWAVPFGIAGARFYHDATDPELYFTAGKHPIEALYIWRGGLGIWGGVAARRPRRLDRLPPQAHPPRRGRRRHGPRPADCPGDRTPGQLLQELYGRPSGLPWGGADRPAQPARPQVTTYQPTFLYEALWDLGVAGLVVWAERRYDLGRGRAFALYVAAYTVGRGWVEALRVDHANHLLGLRVND